MNDQPYMPDPAVDKRLLANLHRSCLEMAELGLQLEEVIAKLEHHNRQRRLQQSQRSHQRPSKVEGVSVLEGNSLNKTTAKPKEVSN